MTQPADRFSNLLKTAVALFFTSSAAFAGSNYSIPIELCRGDSAHVEIELPAGATLVHGPSGNAGSYAVTLREPATIHPYVDCVHIEADTSGNESQANDELHLPPDGNRALNIKGTVIRRAASIDPNRKSEEKPKLTNRINWPN